MIVHFADKNTEAIFRGKVIKRVPIELQQNVLRKLQMLHAASRIADVQAVPGLRCKAIEKPLWSIRVNDQHRITFTFTEPPLEIRDAMFTDYH